MSGERSREGGGGSASPPFPGEEDSPLGSVRGGGAGGFSSTEDIFFSVFTDGGEGKRSVVPSPDVCWGALLSVGGNGGKERPPLGRGRKKKTRHQPPPLPLLSLIPPPPSLWVSEED